MKETILSTCEKAFVVQCIKENQRLDGRSVNEFRPLRISFGDIWSSVHVSLGETRVLAQVSCELGQPKSTRPNEGMLYINVELSPMAAGHFEVGRSSDLTVQINRTLERTLKDSKCVDLESLCITAEDKVWILRCDLVILNHDGNLIDCASVAALCSLAHFKCPDVTVCGEEIKVHTAAERDPIPLALHHYPVCVSYATFQDGEMAVADPTVIEERCSEANMVFGLNSFRELCCLNLGGTTHTSTTLLLKCSHRAAARAALVVDQIKEALNEDMDARVKGKDVGFTECLKLQKITSLVEDRLCLKIPHFSFDTSYKQSYAEPKVEDESETIHSEYNTGVLSSNQSNIKWVDEDEDSEGHNFSEEYEDEENLEQELETAKTNLKFNQQVNEIAATVNRDALDTSSEREEKSTMILG